MKKITVIFILSLLSISFTFTSIAAVDSYTENFDSYEADFELSSGSAWPDWQTIRPTQNGTFVRLANGNKFAEVTSYFHAQYNKKLSDPYVYEVDVFNETKNNVLAFFVRAGEEMFDVQYGKASGYEYDGDAGVPQPTVGSSGFYILPNNGKTLSINIKTYDESKTFDIGNVQFSVDVNADFSTDFRTLKFVDDGETVKVYAEDELAFIVSMSNPGKYTLGEESYFKKVVVKDKNGDVLGTVENARVSVESIIIIGSREATFKYDNIKISAYEPATEPNTQTYDSTTILALVICAMIALGLIKRRQFA